MESSPLGNKSFFQQSPAPAQGSGQKPEGGKNAAGAAQVIQHWWKLVHLKQTAKESTDYLNDVSLKDAKHKSFSKLEAFILDKNTQEKTHKLLLHLEQAKDVVLAARGPNPELQKPERVFLSAYLIAAKSKYLFESPADIDELLLQRANEMLKHFECLCKFMGETYMVQTPKVAASPMVKRTPSSSQVLSYIEEHQLQHSREMMKNNHQFIREGKPYLEAFHQAQMAYYETFRQWETKNRYRLASVCIKNYLNLEEKRFAMSTNPDPRQLEFYEGFGNQQETLKRKIIDLLGDEGPQLLDPAVKQLRVELEKRKWVTAPIEALIHEMAVNPTLTLPPIASKVKPQINLEAAIEALSKLPANIEPIQEVFQEIFHHLSSFTPHNKRRTAELDQILGKRGIKTLISSFGLEDGIYKAVYFATKKIKEIESPVHEEETVLFQQQLNQKMGVENSALLLKEAVDFLYSKFSEINLEMNKVYIRRARHIAANTIVEYEQRAFKERLKAHQFNLSAVLEWRDNIVDAPDKYRINPSSLFSDYIAGYVSIAILIGVLEKPGAFDLYSVPETFYLDREHLINWQGRYQTIFYTAAATGFLTTFCQQYGINLSNEEILEQKKIMKAFLAEEKTPDVKRIAAQVMGMLKEIFLKNKKSLSNEDTMSLARIMEDICSGKHKAAEIIYKRLGGYLTLYLKQGYVTQAAVQANLYGVIDELHNLGKEILPAIRLHIKVHGDFYRQSVRERLWKPLIGVFKNPEKAGTLPDMFQSQQEEIGKVNTAIQKLSFLLSGLALIQQNVVYADMWSLDRGIKITKLKSLAGSLQLIDMLNDASSSKDMMENKLIELMNQVADEEELPYDQDKEQKFEKMISLAKNHKSPGCKAFLDEISTAVCNMIKSGEKPTYRTNPFIAEFIPEIEKLCFTVKNIVNAIRMEQLPDDYDPITPDIPTLRSGRTVLGSKA